MKQTKILIIVTDLTLGGVQNYVRKSAMLLYEMGYNVSIIAINESHPFKNINTISLIKYKSFQKPFFIRKFVKENAVDLILDHRSKSNFIKQKVYDALLSKTPKAQFIHSANLKMYFYQLKWLNTIVYKNTDVFVSVSEFIDGLVKKQINRNSTVAYYFFDFTKHNNTSTNGIKKDILFIGRFDNDAKDLLFLLEAYKQSKLNEQNIRFNFLGAGKDEVLIIDFVKENHLEHCISINKPVEDTSAFYKSAKAVVLASNFEGLPLVLLEALYYNTPVITTIYNPSVFEIVKHDVNGLIVEKNRAAFANALQTFFLNDNYYEKWMQRNTEMLPKHFTKENAKLIWIKIIEDLLKNRVS
ncbi:glycosyltransferase [Flavobacterium sp. xlx-214]|uniref:glycosyltransferase n=1 Tax=unclassified Flavobacterium TaxID=196869 RepID=UPI0013D41A23|nr:MULTISPECIES: glycosyltransferase [unclassified Flavobacterium]MBA5791368.1 glycosyltransferase [Flavobacterium sp. xlx-221]QMI83479.1 glycosyltransferase [Flavobacterium sp. xlx-214]